MKQVLIYIICVIFLFCGNAVGEEPLVTGLLVTVIQDNPVLSSREEILKLIGFAKKADIKVFYVQIYRANQAWFPSKMADCGPYENCLANVSEDPFRLLIKEAHASGIKVYAWLNLLSLGSNKDAKLLKKYGTDILTRNVKAKKSIEDYKIDNQYFLEPGDPRVRAELSMMVEEILRRYTELDGVLFDYIRYPDMNPHYGYAETNVARYKKETGHKKIKEGSPAWDQWKRGQVTELLRELISKSRAIRPDIKVATTGCAPYSRAYFEAFQDWRSWLKQGFIDSVTVMVYSPVSTEFERFVLDVKRRAGDSSNVNIAIGAYEMDGSPEILEREMKFCKDVGGYNCTIFHYGSLIQDPSLGRILTDSKKRCR